MEIKKVSIVGMGALGLLYADHISRHAGNDAVSFVMDEERLKRHGSEEFFINDKSVKFQMISDKEAKPADLLIVAVKYTGLKDALDVMQTSIDEHTIIMSVMNGISSEEIIGKRYGMNRVLYTVAQGMDAMRFGSSLRFTQMGALHIGTAAGGDPEILESVKAYFDRIAMPYVEEEDILWRMWFKYMLNVGINQTCMVYNTTYSGAITEGTDANRTLIAAMREVLAIANAKSVKLTEADINKCIEIEKTLDPDGTPSMGQDRINKKHSEVEMFAGTVIRMGEELGILVPENKYIYEQVQKIEREY